MGTNRAKLLVIVFLAFPLLIVTVFKAAPRMAAANNADDPAVTYKAKCAMCHSPKAEKAFDPSKADDVLTEIVLKGKKGEKPPFMPGFEAKGMTADEAKGLVTHMKGLRASAN